MEFFPLPPSLKEKGGGFPGGRPCGNEYVGMGSPPKCLRVKEPQLLAKLPPFLSLNPCLYRRESSGIPSDEDLPNLPSDPRLADVVSARLALTRLFNVSSSSPWICFGGSYAGSLAAWARLKVPDLLWVGWEEGTWTPEVTNSDSLSTCPPRSLLPHLPFPQKSFLQMCLSQEHRR